MNENIQEQKEMMASLHKELIGGPFNKGAFQEIKENRQDIILLKKKDEYLEERLDDQQKDIDTLKGYEKKIKRSIWAAAGAVGLAAIKFIMWAAQEISELKWFNNHSN